MLKILVSYLSYKRQKSRYSSIHKNLYPCKWTNLFIHVPVKDGKYFEEKS